MGQTQSSRNPTEQRSLEEARQFVAGHGVDGIDRFYREQIDAWRHVKLNFLVTGDTGAGKSAFINAIRGLNDFDDGAADVSVVESLAEPTDYHHPSYPNVIFSDVPGIGSPRLPDIRVYRKKIDLKKYDAFLIFSCKRFTNHDLKLAEEARSMNTPFFFIRTHMRPDMETVKRSKEKSSKEFKEEEALAKIRDNCCSKLRKILASSTDIFLIDNYFTKEWDFERLIAGITDVLPERRKECFVLTLSNVTRNCLKRKAKLLKARAVFLATITAPASAIPVPFLGAVIDLALIVKEIKDYRIHFGLPQNDSEEFERLDEEQKKTIVRYCIKSVAQLAVDIASSVALELSAEEVAKYIPLAGTIVAGVVSAGFVTNFLVRSINEMEKAALQIWDRTAGGR